LGSWVVERGKRWGERGTVMPLQMVVLWIVVSSVSVPLSLFPFGELNPFWKNEDNPKGVWLNVCESVSYVMLCWVVLWWLIFYLPLLCIVGWW